VLKCNLLPKLGWILNNLKFAVLCLFQYLLEFRNIQYVNNMQISCYSSNKHNMANRIKLPNCLINYYEGLLLFIN